MAALWNFACFALQRTSERSHLQSTAGLKPDAKPDSAALRRMRPRRAEGRAFLTAAFMRSAPSLGSLRIEKIDRAIEFDHDIVREVERATLKVACQHGDAAVVLLPHHSARRRLAGRE